MTKLLPALSAFILTSAASATPCTDGLGGSTPPATDFVFTGAVSHARSAVATDAERVGQIVNDPRNLAVSGEAVDGRLLSAMVSQPPFSQRPNWRALCYSVLHSESNHLVGFILLLRDEVAKLDEFDRIHGATLDRRTTAMLSYVIDPNFWNRGIASETISALVDHSFRVAKLERLLAYTGASNHASGRVLVKAGFRMRREDPAPSANDPTGTQYFVIERAEWERGRSGLPH